MHSTIKSKMGCIASCLYVFVHIPFCNFNFPRFFTENGTLEASKRLSAFPNSVTALILITRCLFISCNFYQHNPNSQRKISFTWTSMKATGSEFYKTRLLQKIHWRYIQGSHLHRGLQIEGSRSRRHMYYFRILNLAACDESHKSCSYQNHDGFSCGVEFEKMFLKLKERKVLFK